MNFRLFTIGVLMLNLAAYAAEVRLYGFTKARQYRQTTAAKPTAETGFEFHAFVELTRDNAASSVTLKWPNQTVRSLTKETRSWRIRESFPTSSGLNNAAPNGTYTYSITTAGDGLKTIPLTLSGDFYPEIPYLVNFAAAQEIDFTKAFTLSLGPTGADAGDFIHVRLEEGGTLVWETPPTPDLQGALNGTASAITIPTGILKEGQAYSARITIWNIQKKETAAYTGALGVVAYVRQTELTIRTAFATTDAHWFGLMKMQRYAQTSPGTPVPMAAQGFAYQAFAEATAPLSISSGSIRLPNNASKTLAGAGGSWNFGESFAFQNNLDQACPSGVLTMSLNTVHNGLRQVDLQVVQGNYPAAPQITNWDDANRVDPTKQFVLAWAPLGGTAADFVQVRVEKNGQLLFKTGNHPKAAGALTGQSTSIAIPAGTLSAGDEYQVSIIHFKPLFTEPFVYPKSLGVTGVARETRGTIRTRGGNFQRPSLPQAALNGDFFEITIEGTQGRQYVIERTKDYSGWSTLLTTNAPANIFTIRLPHVKGERHNAFRVMSW